MIGYTLLTLAGMVAFGPVAWLRNAELFEVELGWFGRIGPLARRSRTARPVRRLRGGAATPSRASTARNARPRRRTASARPELRPWIVGLTDVGRPGWSDVAFIVLALAGVTYDGLRETCGRCDPASTRIYPAGVGRPRAVQRRHLPPRRDAPAASWSGGLPRRLRGGRVRHPRARRRPSRRRSAPLAGRYAATLLPIAGGYLIAHYLTLVIQGVVWLPSLLADPLMSIAPQLDAIPIVAVWYLSVAAIVGGHIAGIVLAHRLALADAPGRATVAGLPMVALMVGYTDPVALDHRRPDRGRPRHGPRRGGTLSR